MNSTFIWPLLHDGKIMKDSFGTGRLWKAYILILGESFKIIPTYACFFLRPIEECQMPRDLWLKISSGWVKRSWAGDRGQVRPQTFRGLCDHHKSSCLILPIISTGQIDMHAHVCKFFIAQSLSQRDPLETSSTCMHSEIAWIQTNKNAIVSFLNWVWNWA